MRNPLRRLHPLDLALFFVALWALASVAGALAQPVSVYDPLSVPGVEHPADVTVTVTRPDGDELVVDGMRLHGVVWFDRREADALQVGGPWLDLDRQTIRPLRALRGQPAGTTWSASVRPTGRELADVCELAPDRYGDSAPALNWCLWLRSQARQPGMIDTLHVPRGVYGYAGPVLLRDSVHIQGAGGAIRLGIYEDEFGNTFEPVGIADTTSTTTFRVLDGRAFTALGEAMGEPLEDDERLRLALRQDRTAWMLEPDAALLSVSDLVMRGNGEGDLARFMRAKRSSDPAVQLELRNGYQNSPSLSGLVITVHGGLAVRSIDDPRPLVRGEGAEPPVISWETTSDTYPEPGAWQRLRARHTATLPGAIARVSNVSIRGYAATGILGDYRAHWTLDTVELGDALHNHSVYKADGSWRHVTLAGYSWGHAVMQGTDLGTVRDLVIWRQAPNPAGRETGAALDIRLDNGEDLFVDGLYADLRGFPGGHLADVDPKTYYSNRDRTALSDFSDNVGLHLRRAIVVTPARAMLRLRDEGVVDLDSVTVHAPAPEGFELAAPESKTRFAFGAPSLSATAVTVLDDVATQEPVTPTSPVTVLPPTVDPPEKGPSLDPRDARIAELEAQAAEMALLLKEARTAAAEATSGREAADARVEQLASELAAATTRIRAARDALDS